MIELTTEQHEIQEWAREFAARYVAPRALELDKNPESPVRDELIREAAQAGLLGNNLPEFLGGLGHDPLTGALVTEELAAACSSARRCSASPRSSPRMRPWPTPATRSR